MDFLMNINVVMAVVMIATLMFARPFFKYRLMLKEALILTTNPDIKKEVGGRRHYATVYEDTLNEHISLDMVWVPAFYITYTGIALLWIGMSMGVNMGFFSVIVAGAVSAIITRSLTHDHSPGWLMDWTVEMMDAYNQNEYKLAEAELDAATVRIDALMDKDQSGQKLSEEEQIEVYRLILQHKDLSHRFESIKTAAIAVEGYLDLRKNEDSSTKVE